MEELLVQLEKFFGERGFSLIGNDELTKTQYYIIDYDITVVSRSEFEEIEATGDSIYDYSANVVIVEDQEDLKWKIMKVMTTYFELQNKYIESLEQTTSK